MKSNKFNLPNVDSVSGNNHAYTSPSTSPTDSKQLTDDSNLTIRLKKKIQQTDKLPNLPKPVLKKSYMYAENSNEQSLTNKIAKFRLTKLVNEEKMRPLCQNPTRLSIIVPTAEPPIGELRKATAESEPILFKSSIFTTIYKRLNEGEYSRKMKT